ncbi:hypothetical protein BDZ89DRAFT_1138607 [Hymenopellis radicata]|nr:hypothetical protein BDZ89DRAFT_1138607 [Hymenopellis radicata]
MENLSPADAALLQEQEQRKKAEKHAAAMAEKAARLQKKVADLQREAKNARDREKWHKKAKAALQRRLKEKDLKIANLYLRVQCAVAEALADKRQNLAKLEKLLNDANARLAKANEDSSQLQNLSFKQKSDLVLLRKTLHNLKCTVARGRRLRERVLEKAHKAKLLAKMKNKHAFKPQIRTLARTLVSCGCAEGKVGPLIKDVAAIFGVTIKKVMSRRTVRRIILEGLVMANVQLGHEMNATEDLTLSGDSTSRRNQNYQAHHATYRVLEVLPDGTVRLSLKPQIRFMGIQSTVDHTTLKSKESWVKTMQDILSIYVDSPLTKRTAGYQFDLRAICRKLRGMCSDHVNGEKATAEAMEELKREETMKGLGKARKKEMGLEAFEELLREWNWKKIEDAGGWEGYMALTPEERAVRDIATVDAMMKSLGEEEFKTLSAEEQRLLTLFVWSGCCMHKDQNSFKGGNAAMMAAWKALGLQGPIILANKVNAAKVRNVLAPETGSSTPTEAEIAALEASTFGGAKTASLAGAIFNNRCNKKGQGETHVIFLSQKVEKLVRRFPQTNNTQFGSHGEAAGELLLHLKEYREFLLHIKTKKYMVDNT